MTLRRGVLLAVLGLVAAPAWATGLGPPTVALPAAPTPTLANQLQAVDALAARLHDLRGRIEHAEPGHAQPAAWARQLDDFVSNAPSGSTLPPAARAELALRMAWKVEPEVNATAIALQTAAGKPVTEDDRWSLRAREASSALYALRDEVLHAKGSIDAEVQCLRIAPLLQAARPPATASAAARGDFAEVTEPAAIALHSALRALPVAVPPPGIRQPAAPRPCLGRAIPRSTRPSR